MRRPQPLPDDLGHRPFDRAAADRAHISQGRLRRRDVRRPFHGVQAVVEPRTVEERCTAYAVRLKPGQAFSHATAAQLFRLPLPVRLEQAVELHVSATMPAPAPQTRGVVGHRLRIAPPLVTFRGFPVVRVDEVWCQLAGVLDLDELVIVADALLNRSEGRLLAALQHAAGAKQRVGQRKLTRALAEARVGCASPGETRVRLLLARAGIPEPLLNAPVTDRTGRVLGRGDLVWPDARVVLEYEGLDHGRSDDQFVYDVGRYERFRDAGWVVIRVTVDDLTGPLAQALIARVRRYVLAA
jgi:hypothetical protein